MSHSLLGCATSWPQLGHFSILDLTVIVWLCSFLECDFGASYRRLLAACRKHVREHIGLLVPHLKALTALVMWEIQFATRRHDAFMNLHYETFLSATWTVKTGHSIFFQETHQPRLVARNQGRRTFLESLS